jgi:REP element-mobilizing transposase RayT
MNRANAAKKYLEGFHRRGFRQARSERLPHLKIAGSTYFVTYRLADSLPAETLARLREELEAERRRFPEDTPENVREAELRRGHFRRVEAWLDKGHGSCCLRRPEIAGLIADNLRFFDGVRYALLEWVVMPNHVHVLVRPRGNFTLGGIVKTWKQYTARHVKAPLGWGKGRFWQIEAYDHWVRNERELERIRGYIRRNPVKAGLCAAPENWPWGGTAEKRGEESQAKP